MMTNKAYRKAIKAIGLNQVQAGAFFGVTDRTSRNWAAKGPPVAVEIVLFTMIKYAISVDTVNHMLGRS
jgi:hypothetical protein